MIFAIDRKETVLTEMQDASIEVLGSCTSKLVAQKASFLAEKSRNSSKLEENDRNDLVTQMTG